MSYKRRDWTYEHPAKCSECGAPFRVDIRPILRYNLHQLTCSPRCARARKTRLQRKRRFTV